MFVDGEYSKSPIAVGVPQGSNLGPFLFFSSKNDLLDYLPESNIELFVDDNTILVCHTGLGALEDLGVEAQSKACKWFSANGLATYPDKTVKNLFTLRKAENFDKNVIT